MVPRLLIAVVLLAAVAPAALAQPPDDVQKAIRQGQYYLKAIYNGAPRPGGPPPGPVAGLNGGAEALLPFFGGRALGSAALTGLALLESGVPAADPTIGVIDKGLRVHAFQTRATYELGLLIMYFDRLGRKADTPMIQFLTLRLMSGQLRDGSWGYTCDGLALDAVSERQIQAELTKDDRPPPAAPKGPKKEGGKPRTDLDPPPAKKDDPKPEPKKEEPKGLHPLLEKIVAQAGRGSGGLVHGDHSNTQFATVALWVGRRHHVNVSAALKALDKHYRETQGTDGGWTYSGLGGGSTPAMTCAGLMGLAMGFGARMQSEGADKPLRPADPEAIANDPVVKKGLEYVGQFVAAGAAPRGTGGFAVPNDLSNNLYFMWSLERVCMVYGLTTLAKVDWYEWGARSLVQSQAADGSWTCASGYPMPENATAFALLFLSRANLAQDLTASLKGKVRDPGTSRLQSGDLTDLLGKVGTSGSKRPDGTVPKPPASVVKTPPVPKADPVKVLADALVKATPTERAALLAKYRDTKGVDYTDALARALADLSGEAQTEARDALAMRLTRMTPANLVAYMADRNRELRRAAALACAAKGKERLTEFADALIALIGDDDPLVVQAARASLKELSGADHGPDTASTAADRQRALLAWRKWWDGQKK